MRYLTQECRMSCIQYEIYLDILYGVSDILCSIPESLYTCTFLSFLLFDLIKCPIYQIDILNAMLDMWYKAIILDVWYKAIRDLILYVRYLIYLFQIYDIFG